MRKEDIDRNLKLVEENKALDMPLAVLNGEFKRAYSEKYDVNIPLVKSKSNIIELMIGGKIVRNCIICNKEFRTYKKNKIICGKKSCIKKNEKELTKVENRNPIVRFNNQKYCKRWREKNEKG